MLARCSITATAAIAASLTVGCGPKGEERAAPQILGALSGNVSTFTTAPGGCVVSAIFDNDRVQWTPGETAAKGRTAKAQKRWLELAVPASAAGAELRVDLRGGYMSAGPGASATANLTVAGRKTSIALPNGGTENEIYQRVAAPIPAGARKVAVVIETSAEKPGDPATQVMLDIDSLDIALISTPACGGIS